MDRSGVLTLDGEQLPPAGAIVRVRVDAPAGAAPQSRGWALLTPYCGATPFPPLDGEHYRVHRGAPSRAENLRRRARILAATRAFFDRRGFLEVQTPLRVRVPGLEPQLVAERAGDHYLITSPEYHMKRLLAGGLERIYFLGSCFRAEEHGPQHLGEFTMLEWYRAHATLDEVRADAEDLLRAAAAAVPCGPRLRIGEHEARIDRPFVRVTVAAACAEHAGVNVVGVTDAGELRRRMVAAGFALAVEETAFDELFSRLLVERVEPALARLGAPVFLCDFPAPLAALARLKADDPAVCERFELYAAGLELANAFGELADPDEQRARLEEEQRIRRERGAAVYPIDERFIAALREGIPPSAGVALGLDRLVMLLCGTERIADVVAFATDEV